MLHGLLIDDGPFSSSRSARKIVERFLFLRLSLLQAIDAVMSLALCSLWLVFLQKNVFKRRWNVVAQAVGGLSKMATYASITLNGWISYGGTQN